MWTSEQPAPQMFTLHTHPFVHASHCQDSNDHCDDTASSMIALLAEQPRAQTFGKEIISQFIQCSLIHWLANAIVKWNKGRSSGHVSFIIKSQEASPRPLGMQGFPGWSQWNQDAPLPDFQMPSKCPLETCWSGSTWNKQKPGSFREVNSNPLWQL